MLRHTCLALLAGASLLAGGIDRAAAFDSSGVGRSTAIYANPPPPAEPVRTAYGTQTNLGGGLIEFLFGDPQVQRQRYGQPIYQQGLPYEPVRPQQLYPRPDQAYYSSQRPFDPKYERQLVEYDGRERPGTIIIDTSNKFLYLVQGNGMALRYGIGVGRPGFTWSGVKTISAKREWPDWTPPAQMLARRPDLPRHMEGGTDNPLGARAMYLGSSLYRIHGSNEPWTIGTNVSSGCIRMRNEDVIDLYARVNVGTKVIIL